jgi:hypothetical protein
MTANTEEGNIGEVRTTKRLSIKMEPVSGLRQEVGQSAGKKGGKKVPRRRPGKPKPKTA